MTVRPMSIYLAGPIDTVSDEDARGWREQAADQIPTGVLLFSPAHAYFGAGQATARELDFLNTTMIKYTDATIANLSLGLSIGTLREVERASAMQKPVAVIADPTLNMQVAALVAASLMTYDVHVVETFDEAIGWAMEQVNQNRQQPYGPGIMLLGGPPPEADES